MNEIKIKYCGLRTADDVAAAAAARAYAIGFVFVEKSPRYITAELAKPLVQQAKALNLLTVALFADQDVDVVDHIIQVVKPDVLQFHGMETRAFCEQFNKPYWKAIPMLAEVDYLQYMKQYPSAEAYLLDAFGQQQSGGSGQSFEWFEFPNDIQHKLILAGGINATNVEAALAATQAQFIDTSSGIESRPGVKSKTKMLALADLIHNK